MRRNLPIVFFVSTLFFASPIFADDTIVEAEVDWFSEILKGGGTAVALILLLMAGIYFIVERLLSLRNKFIVPGTLAETVEPLWHEKKYNKILDYCHKHPSTLARMVEYLINHRNADPGLLIPGAQDIASRELKTHAQKAFSLAVIASLAPLLGLLGTMIGMIESFKLVEIYGDEGGASMLAGSISKALITTAVGLIIAIPALAFYHGMKYKINLLSERLEEQLEFLVNSWLLGHASGRPVEKNSSDPLKKSKIKLSSNVKAENGLDEPDQTSDRKLKATRIKNDHTAIEKKRQKKFAPNK